ncbi:hypothetical protein BH11PLA2_BH11PLA2_42930 [soil metagenome]
MRDESLLRRSTLSRLLHLAVLFLPVFLLAAVATIATSPIIIAGGVVALIFATVLIRRPMAWRPPTSGPVILLYLGSLVILWLSTRGTLNAVSFAARGTLFVAVSLLIVVHDLFRTGAEPRRRAQKWCARLQARRDWPADVVDVIHLPEVYGLRDAAEVEPGPVFDLFRDVRPEVRASAFGALAGRPNWRPREAAAVLEEAKKTAEAPVRVLAMTALSRIEDPAIVEGLTGFYHDPSPEVRAAAVWASLSDGGRRWGFVRDAIRGMLSDPRNTDAALPGAAGCLPVVALCDLTAWAAEPEPLSLKSVRTLVDHYNRVLQTTGDYDLITDLTNQVLDTATPTALRVELAGMLRNLGLLTPELLDRMTNADQPGPVRLLAAEAMLTLDPYHPDGLDVLRGLGRQPNREMALAIANVLQFRLGYDMGLTAEGIPPMGKVAGEVAKKVMGWAIGRGNERRAATPSPGHMAFPAASDARPPLLPVTPDPGSAPDLPLPNLPLRKLSNQSW